MIHICFGLHDKSGTYSKYTGAAICSLMENTQQKICVHLLHDETLNVTNKLNFQTLAAGYGQKICFYKVTIDPKLEQLDEVKRITVGTLLRLKMVDVLPKTVEKVIYLDSDIIVNLDIAKLWQQNFNGKALLGRLDHPGKRLLCESGVLSYSSYINAGVLLLNVKKIRDCYQFYDEAVHFLERYPDCRFLDQDAINYIFKHDLGLMAERFNLFTLYIRNEEQVGQSAIYHFAGDTPRSLSNLFIDKLFLTYLLKTPWGNAEDIMNHYIQTFSTMEDQFQFVRSLIKKTGDHKKIFFGAGGKIHSAIMKQFTLEESDYFVDNNSALWGQSKQNTMIKNPEVLLSEIKDKVFIIVTTLRYAEIKLQLERYGYQEDKNFFDGRRLLLESEGGYATI